ncbi:hypothetical protein F3Y22_tig00110940pilonHSYRG00420 [Hibiscus syriacus]|uniref:Uncharacterized protein n=1 Tax=Hibiscus syriacus TaxID=106335 RepID=A0A6A2ZBQ1_HIBSY|nr:hypothetical protein F3Y22_tig00110940pilonHSYRG00420 [Hibiscus syriacus]
MAEIRDRHQPQQVQVHPQYRYDNSAGWHTACVIGANTGRYRYRAITSDTALPNLQPDSGPGHHSHFDGRDGVLVVRSIRVDGVVIVELRVEQAEACDGDGADGLGGGKEEDAGYGRVCGVKDKGSGAEDREQGSRGTGYHCQDMKLKVGNYVYNKQQ